MQYIDAFNHFFPRAFFDKMLSIPGTEQAIGKRVRAIPCIYDLDERFRVMDMFKDKNYSQVLSISQPPLDDYDPAIGHEMSKLANDGLAELAQKYPDRFPGYTASVCMTHPDAARELERAFDNGANGVQIYSNIAGRPLDEPEFFGIFETCARRGKPILIHPCRGQEMTDYKNEDKSKYEIWWTFGWPYETSAAMARIVFSGMMDKLPELKIVAHHLGAMVPYFEGRVGPGWDQLGKRTSDATECGLAFYGQDKVLFASDCPFDPERGPGYIRETIDVLEAIDMPQEMREKIAYKNAQELFGLK